MQNINKSSQTGAAENAAFNADKSLQDSALVVLSGGQDSSIALALSLHKYKTVHTIGFDYGQRNKVELECRQQVLSGLKEQFPELGSRLATDKVIEVHSFGQVAESAYTGEGDLNAVVNNLPASFVPGRNLMFLTYAAARAYCVGAHTIVMGVSQADYSGYPDCRQNTMQAMQQALSLGCEYDFTIETPFMFLDKAQEWALAEQTGGTALVDFLVKTTHTCYEGDHEHLHEWGYGCGKCAACRLREAGFRRYLQQRQAGR